MTYTIRSAVVADASSACEVVRRSIIELCVNDHRNDDTTLAAWLLNKTAWQFEEWIRSDGHLALVAEGTDGVIGFGLLDRLGSISLLYVVPEARIQGVSRSLLMAMEDVARSLGHRTLALASIETARRFYLSAGYEPDGAATEGFGGSMVYPMSKPMAP